MSNQVFHYSNSGISYGQRFYLKDEVSGIFLNKLNVNVTSGIVTLTNAPILSGNPLITGNLSLYATTVNLISTGSRIDTLSGNLITTGSRINTLSGQVVFTTGNQTISGVKTFDKASGNFILFNSATAPSSPVKGQLWFDTVGNNFSGYNGTSWLKLNN